MRFEQAFERLIGHEGGFSDDPKDRGNWTPSGILRGTKYGISARAYPDEDIEGLTLDRAQDLYRRDYWDRLDIDSFPDVLRMELFDIAVNAGVATAAKCLQRACGVEADGVLGPVTRRALFAQDPQVLFARLVGYRLLHLISAPTWRDHGRGWSRRVALNLIAGGV